MAYELRTTGGAMYLLDDAGNVLGRSNGPKGWRYSGQWRITGIRKRHHSAFAVSLADAAAGEDIGQGWVSDLDHGTHRQWGNERATYVGVCDPSREALLRELWQVPS